MPAENVSTAKKFTVPKSASVSIITSVQPATTAGRATGHVTCHHTRARGNPSDWAASASDWLRSANALRASMYTYGYSARLRNRAAPGSERTCGNQ